MSRNDAGDARSDAPAESRFVRLTLPPIVDLQDSDTGLGDAVSLDGVKVCAALERPWGAEWDDFQDAGDRWCAVSVANEPVVLDAVPGVSELIVTAEKDDYIPSAFAVTTDRWDLDGTAGLASAVLRMRRRDAPFANLPAGEAISPDLGLVDVVIVACAGNDCRFAGGASVTMEPSPSHVKGPFYWKGGVLDPTATRTPEGGTVIGAGPNEATGASFADVPAGEYDIVIDRPGTTCRPAGFFDADAFAGFSSSRRNAIGVPVLPGHLTANITAICSCDVPPALEGDSGSCSP